jgi:hypothetical protein
MYQEYLFVNLLGDYNNGWIPYGDVGALIRCWFEATCDHQPNVDTFEEDKKDRMMKWTDLVNRLNVRA